MPKTAAKKGTTSTAGKRSSASGSEATSRSGSRSNGTAGTPTSRSRSTSVSSGENMKGSLLHEFFLDALKDIYWAEKALVKGLQKLAKNATSEDLQNAFMEHKDATENHVERLEQVFELLEKKPQAKKCEAMAGLLEEANSVIEDTADDTYTRDCALIVSAQKVEHYEIAAYGSLVTIARAMGHTEAADLLAETLDEEKETDELLTEIAEGHINEEALAEGNGEEEEEEEEEE